MFNPRRLFGLLAMALTVLGFSGFAMSNFAPGHPHVEVVDALPPALMYPAAPVPTWASDYAFSRVTPEAASSEPVDPYAHTPAEGAPDQKVSRSCKGYPVPGLESIFPKGNRCMTYSDEFRLELAPRLNGNGYGIKIWTKKDNLYVLQTTTRLDGVKVQPTRQYQLGVDPETYVVREDSHGGPVKTYDSDGRLVDDLFVLESGTLKVGFVIGVAREGGNPFSIMVMRPADAAPWPLQYPSR